MRVGERATLLHEPTREALGSRKSDLVSPKFNLEFAEFNIEPAEFNIEFGDYKTALRRFKTGFAKFNIESGNCIIVPRRFKTVFPRFNIESDAYKTDPSRFKIEARRCKTLEPRFNVQPLPSCFPIRRMNRSIGFTFARLIYHRTPESNPINITPLRARTPLALTRTVVITPNFARNFRVQTQSRVTT